MYEIVLANATHAVVAVELSYRFSRWRRGLLHWSAPSSYLLIVSASLQCSSSLILDSYLQVVEHVHVTLLSAVES